eukprot:CAMPEP_0201530006 /NCGR_PEP_ID=MMETSP0161_2-20130828/43452_1 /ASSEMBLY_ACC=CAM_ASM_000251 /TAXON_ID=180227 /ORGANISM="Neoparamoeba aestuarina, Strain SoJaBio B1-5/56/2" /LENGTH=270 /DNA_ID=CAMNT_0047932115 /DNA_START=196 /DNA_END=1005 /DNA_ORIENTATION=-
MRLDSVNSPDLPTGDKAWAYESVSVVRFSDWFDDGFFILHLQYRPHFFLSAYADFLHVRTGTRKRTLIPEVRPKLKVVYIWREPDVSAPNRFARQVVNQQQFIDVMGRMENVDFNVIRGETKSPKNQLQMMEDAGILISVHGAGLANMLFLPKCAAIIELFPANSNLSQHPANTFPNLAHMSGKIYFPYISSHDYKTTPPTSHLVDIRRRSTFVVIDEFLELFKRVKTAVELGCEGETPAWGVESVRMNWGSNKFAEEIDEEIENGKKEA